MKSDQETVASPVLTEMTGAWPSWRSSSRRERLRISGALGWIVVITLAFSQQLAKLILYASQSSLLSYIPLVPFVACYLLFIKHRTTGRADYSTSVVGTMLTIGVGFAALAGAIQLHDRLSVNDDLSLMALAYVSFVAAGGFLFFGSKWMADAAFPVAFLFFMVPLPDALVNWLETASVLASADVAAWFFNLTGTPLLRYGTLLTLPGISLKVAQECSGIHSSWVLLITSLLASNLFLKSSWRRLFLVAFVIPLGIVRNGFRILVIGLLCVHIGPEMIDSPIHHQGGPIFFALSLIPLFLLLWWLRSQEQR